MTQFLFIADVPTTTQHPTTATEPPEWTAFRAKADSILNTAKNVKRYQKNSWLFPVENSLPTLLALSSAANEAGLTYSAILIEGEVTEITSKTPMKINPNFAEEFNKMGGTK